MLKLIPSIILTIFTGFLIVELYKAEERSARLKNGGPNGAMAAPSNRAPQVRLQVVHSIDKYYGSMGSGVMSTLELNRTESILC